MTMDQDISTSKFRQAISYTLQPIFPTLAALHTRRTRRIDTTGPDSEFCCARCGLYLFAGVSSTRVVRTKSSSKGHRARNNHTDAHSTRTRQTSCLQCGWTTEFPLDRGSESLFPKRRNFVKSLDQPSVAVATSSKVIMNATIESGALPHDVTTVARDSTPTVATSVAKSKPRPKKKNGLQAMLAQNRAKEAQAKAKNSSTTDHPSLAAFLDTL
ncbi:hypothetical protein BDP27DRAFT_1314393 [Rhodocollybia butyracea]|uniref:Uncharacterized protein n=1 Tax=Rhodocollybia butyracea TaxID=206335 RepID=A0A9P5Q7Q7_9AGAR|nr:hypothetical protein BDP27DRAFT_1314393 [Rhodocollybia butyracea]